ncbi:thiol:disulfide interchange protein DsbA/DsbL [Collimonas pratensis]|uniref:Thiol:disulfide interchange protein DsbA n=1 Tax=Collimonas pratensis TaxID=279113 RepID=A0A127QC80_9BURK|nr:thiol:disulfide interchange protein DsbA/DsbL [Collimonas pratensis]AMP07668.1 thiol:disulfide interchange protein DsbA [Collimonas pratensis]AMP17369.1 thiol:disulfide interchange protein DsbA [Collimonas pratensis]NKI71271.1 thioredoxin domain-containing protein [Collimonas pratensis]
MRFLQKALAVAGLSLSLGLVAVSAGASPANPVAGTDYKVLDNPQPTDSGLGKKVEVTEFFGYFCPHCNALEPTLEDWVAKQGDKISFKRVPVDFGDPSAAKSPYISQKKLYYTLEAMGKLPEMHKKVFNAIHVQRQNLNNDDAVADFAAKSGLDKAKFVSIYNSFAVQTKVTRATQLQNAYKVDGVPMLVVDGRFVTSPSIVGAVPGAGDTEAALFKTTLQVMDSLVAKAAATKK